MTVNGQQQELRSDHKASTTNKTKAYAVLAGGGVKGAALVGGLKAAEELHNIDFVGYGGASAGGLVALLAALKYSSKELYSLIVETDFCTLLDDSGASLNRLRLLGWKRYSPKFWMLLNKIRRELGLYGGDRLEEFLLQRIWEKCGNLKDIKEVSFNHLKSNGCKQLKIIVSDISQRKALVYSASGIADEIDDSVCHAVTASVSFPFVFKPVNLHTRRLVDGGLSSNLPAFLFAREQKRTGFPVFAFDLILPDRAGNGRYRIRDFCGDLIATALEAGDDLHLRTINDYTSNIFYIPIEVPKGIDTLKFSLSKPERESLYNAGYRQAAECLGEILRNVRDANTVRESVQAIRHAPDFMIQPLLKSLVREIEEGASKARAIRATIMLPIEEDKLMVTYQFGMNKDDPDKELIVRTDSKWGRKVFHDRQPTFSDLNKLRQHPELWGITKQQLERIRSDRQTIFSVPILEQRVNAQKVTELNCLGILNLDTETPLGGTLWLPNPHHGNLEESEHSPLRVMMKWADIIARVIK